MGSSQTRAQTRVPCISRQILNHCAIREALLVFTLLLICDIFVCCLIFFFFFFMSGIVFLFYWLFGLRLPTLESVGYWVELGLGAEMRTSVRSHSDEYSLGSEVLC